MENTPLISIITITRNRGYLISTAISSILQQTYKNIEYIVVNGASTDNTVEIVNSFNDQRIKLINLEKNFSFPQSINIGVNNSSGEYLTFLDDDDEYLPSKIEKQFNLIRNLPQEYGFVYCWMDYFDKKTQNKIKEHHPKLKGFIPDEVVERPIISGTPTLFFRKESFISLGGFKDDIGIISDWELAARACQIYKVDFVPEALVKVYVNHGSKRMSDKYYYKGILTKNIIFHLHFLKEFKNVFDKYPPKKNNHLYSIARSYFLLGKWKQGEHFYKALINNTITVKYILLPFYCFFLRIIQNGNKNK